MPTAPIKLINFIDLTQDETEMVLEWRNHIKVRKMMYNQHIITLAEHLYFINHLKNEPNMHHFLLKGEEYLGVINFKENHFGLYANPQRKGVGKTLMREVIHYGFQHLKLKSLIAEVFENNPQAIALYKKFHFKPIGQDKNILTMELINDNSQL